MESWRRSRAGLRGALAARHCEDGEASDDADDWDDARRRRAPPGCPPGADEAADSATSPASAPMLEPRRDRTETGEYSHLRFLATQRLQPPVPPMHLACVCMAKSAVEACGLGAERCGDSIIMYNLFGTAPVTRCSQRPPAFVKRGDGLHVHQGLVAARGLPQRAEHDLPGPYWFGAVLVLLLQALAVVSSKDGSVLVLNRFFQI